MKRIILIISFISAIVGACNRPQNPQAEILITTQDGVPVQQAWVNINSKAAKLGTVDVNLKTDVSGKVYFERQFECILEAKATKDTLEGTEYFQMKMNEVTKKTIIIK
jgi:alkyl hydroperoxide reductase subunit AhpC